MEAVQNQLSWFKFCANNFGFQDCMRQLRDALDNLDSKWTCNVTDTNVMKVEEIELLRVGIANPLSLFLIIWVLLVSVACLSVWSVHFNKAFYEWIKSSWPSCLFPTSTLPTASLDKFGSLLPPIALPTTGLADISWRKLKTSLSWLQGYGDTKIMGENWENSSPSTVLQVRWKVSIRTKKKGQRFLTLVSVFSIIVSRKVGKLRGKFC